MDLPRAQMEDLRKQSSRLKELSSQRATPERWQEAVGGLNSKFEGIQVGAACVLASWGGRDAVDLLRDWLMRLYENEDSFSARIQAVRCLARIVDRNDATWVLDLFFGLSDPVEQHWLLPLVAALPSDTVRSRLVTESKSDIARNRLAAMKAISQADLPDKQALLGQFAQDENKTIRSNARQLAKRAAKGA